EAVSSYKSAIALPNLSASGVVFAKAYLGSSRQHKSNMGEKYMAKLTKFIAGGASAISRLPSFLIGLLIIVVLAGGAYGAWRVVSHCSGQSLGACFLSAINPLPASYGRGAGEPLRCADNEETDAGLCYAKCQAGYKGVGPVCWQEACPAGFRDDGTFCAKPQPYDTGA